MQDSDILAILEGKSINELSDIEKNYIRQRIIPKQEFSTEQKLLLKDWWLVVPDAVIPEIEGLNTGDIRLSMRQTKSGEFVIPVDPLTNYDPGTPYERYRDLLQNLEFKKLSVDDLISIEFRIPP